MEFVSGLLSTMGIDGEIALHVASASTHFFFFSRSMRHTRLQGDWSSDVCSSDLTAIMFAACGGAASPSPAARGPAATPAPGDSQEPAESPAGEIKEGGTLIVALPGDIDNTEDRKSVVQAERVESESATDSKIDKE